MLKNWTFRGRKAGEAHEEAGSFIGKGLAAPHAAAWPRAPAPARAAAKGRCLRKPILMIIVAMVTLIPSQLQAALQLRLHTANQEACITLALNNPI